MTLAKLTLIIRKVLGFLLLADLLWVLAYAKLLGLFLWLVFFNVAIIFCLVLLLTKRNNVFIGLILFLLGLFYCYLPFLPGPVLTMPQLQLSNLSAPSENQLLFVWIFIAKWLVLISGVCLFASGFIKKKE